MFNLTGTTLGKYRVTERIGRGGMAEVYKGIHPTLGSQVAIKVLYSHLSEEEGFLGRFEREAQAVAALQHPHLVRVFDYEAEGELSYMVMDFIDGGTLKQKIQELSRSGAHLPYRESFRIFRQVAEAVDYAHRKDMVHRDIKSANILLDKGGNAFLTDFGIARIISNTQFTATGALLGTPMYMSPEQCQGEKVTSLSDIYSLGIALFEMVTGSVPFETETPLSVIHKHIYEPMPEPSEYRPDIPETLEKVIMKSLEKEPADRYQTAQEMLRALAEALPDELETHTILSISRADETRAIKTEEPQKERLDQTEPVIDIGEQQTEAILEPVEMPVPEDVVTPTPPEPEPLIDEPVSEVTFPESETEEEPIDRTEPDLSPVMDVSDQRTEMDDASAEWRDVEAVGLTDALQPDRAAPKPVSAPEEYKPTVIEPEEVQPMTEIEETADVSEQQTVAILEPEATRDDTKVPVSKPKKKFKISPAVIIGGVLVLAIIAFVLLGPVFGIISLGGGDDDYSGGEEEVGLCFGIEECMGQAWDLKENGEFDRVHEALERMKEFIYEDDTIGWSHKMCEASDLLIQMGDHDPAWWYAEQCFEMTEGIPELEDQRHWAEELLQHLSEQ
jgi:serine/threonine-protein kinase